MAVTLPLTMLLFDLWPLRMRPSVKHLAPVAAGALACGVLTLAAQRAANAIQPVESYALSIRLGNAVVSYGWYLLKMVWPSGLAVFYPHPLHGLSLSSIAFSAALLAGITALAVTVGRSFRPLSMGWWWYLGTLLPVAGIIQVGSQARADRYAYVPLIGIFIIAAWSAARLVARAPKLKAAVAVAAVAAIAALSLVTRAQIPYWKDSVALFSRAIAVVPNNAIAHNNLGMALVVAGRLPEALPHFKIAVVLTPDDTDARSNLGNALRTLGRAAEAVPEYEKALELAPTDPTIHYNLATALLDLGRTAEAAQQLKEAVGLDPGYEKAQRLLLRIEGQPGS
jgi:tetratricopeptide (TPR) repeat protein